MKTKPLSVSNNDFDQDIEAMKKEVARIQQKLNKNRQSPKYCRRSQSYDAWFAEQGRLSRQLQAASDAIEIYSRHCH